MNSQAGAGPSYTVLRIKRKATDQPLSSLVIEDRSTRGIKKRLVSSRNRGVFRLAETVPETWAGRGVEAETLKQRIRGLLEHPAGPQEGDRRESPVQAQGLSAEYNCDDGRETETAPRAQPVPPLLAPQPAHPGPDASFPTAVGSPAGPLPPRSTSMSQQAAAQYRVVRPPSPRTRSLMPPRVIDEDDDGVNRQSPFHFIDAQAVPSPLPGTVKSPVRVPTAEEEKEMASFLPMLQEYLKLEEKTRAEEAEAAAAAAAAAAAKRIQRSPSPDAETETYVYDLYYRDVRDSGISGLGAGDGVTPSTAVGALLDYELFSPPSSPSSSEPEDEADEDSNEEDFYRNDYPEDEDADEDMREYEHHSGSEGEDDYSSEEMGGGSGSHSGGMWNYR